jgi:AcrR family transcriptional regulator
MVRWEPDARERLGDAALELYATRGFDETTVAEIAQSVGLTERTFFRHFTDKREVVFGRQEMFQAMFTDAVATAEGGPLDIVRAAVLAGCAFFADERRDHSVLRQRVITTHPELQERELLKMAALATAIAAALRTRGIADPVATLAAESGVVVFRVAFEQWLADGETRPLSAIATEGFTQLAALARS